MSNKHLLEIGFQLKFTHENATLLQRTLGPQYIDVLYTRAPIDMDRFLPKSKLVNAVSLYLGQILPLLMYHTECWMLLYINSNFLFCKIQLKNLSIQLWFPRRCWIVWSQIFSALFMDLIIHSECNSTVPEECTLSLFLYSALGLKYTKCINVFFGISDQMSFTP